MSALLENPALRRKITAHLRAQPAPPDPTWGAGRAFGRALRRAGAAFDGLGLVLGPVQATTPQGLEPAMDAIPQQGLVVVLEDGAGQRGLIGLSSALVDALIEVQTTGRVEADLLAPRPITRIDEALARDFVDLVLAGFAQEAQALEGRDWPDRMGYGSRIADPGQINLLLPDADYCVLAADVSFDGVDRQARLVMAVPRGRSAVVPTAKAVGRPIDPAWQGARARMLANLRLPLDVVLLRQTRPLAEVQRLSIGDLLFFSKADLEQVAIETPDGRGIAHGKLGQVNGQRAVRLPAAPPQAQPTDTAARIDMAGMPPPAADPAPRGTMAAPVARIVGA